MPDPSHDVVEPSFERRIVTVLFADLVGFTSLSERLDPEDVATIQDAYFTTVRETVARHGGQLEKFIGDAAMAVFGIPRAHDDDAERAIRAGLALVGAVEALGARLGLEEGDTGLRLRAGVNSGEVVSAERGPDTGRVTGDTVNLAARFQTAAEPGTVLLGQLTALAAADAVELEPVGELTLKGKAEPIRAWRVTGLRPERSRERALGALRAPLLGREAELAQLNEALHAAGNQNPQLILIVAPPGVGKSRLLLEFAARAEAAGALVLRARVRPDVIGPAEPVGQLLLAALERAGAATREASPEALREALTRSGTADGRAQVVVDEVTATLWPTTDGSGLAPEAAGAPSSDVAQERDTRFGAWLEALDALAGNHPSAWLVEDVHWAGGDLLAFLARAGSEPSRTGRLVVASARPSVLEQSPQATTVLQLPPLPALDSAGLVTALIGEALPTDLVAAVAERSDGNPLFIEELLRSWISGGTLVPGKGGVGWQLAVPPGEVPLPATVQAIYAAQLDDLPGPARLVARRASVAGRRFAAGALAPLEVPEPEQGLEQLRRRAFLRGPETDMSGDEVYAYRHALLRDAGYASLSRAERGRLHLALAAWLEQTAGGELARVAEPIASHYEAALAALPGVGVETELRIGLTDAARLWLERAAEAALGVAAHEAAVGLLARAVALAVPDSLDAARLRLRRGELLAATGDLDLGIGEMEAARDVARTEFRGGNPESRSQARAVYGEAVAALGDALIEQIRFIEARDAVAEVLAEITPPEDVLAGRLMALHAWANVAQGDREGTLDEANRALGLVAGADPQVEIEVRSRRALVRSDLQMIDPDEWRELEDLAREHGNWAVAARALIMRAHALEDAIPARELLANLDESVELALNHGLTEQAVWAGMTRTDWLFKLGDWDEALIAGLLGIEIGERNAYFRSVFRTWMVLGQIFSARSDRAHLAQYAEWFDRHRSAFPDPPSAFGQVHMASTDVRLRSAGLPALTDRPISPEVVGAEAFNNADYLAAVETVIHSWIASGDTDQSRRAIAATRTTWFRPGDLPPTHLARASLDLLNAWQAQAEGAMPDAIDAGRRAAEWARRSEAPWWVVRAIRALPEGAPTAEEMAEAEAIERRLKVVPGATAPPV